MLAGLLIDDISNDTSLSSGTVLSDLPNGVHNLTIIATDFMSRIGKSTVIFTIEIPLSSTPESSTRPSSANYSLYSIIFGLLSAFWILKTRKRGKKKV